MVAAILRGTKCMVVIRMIPCMKGSSADNASFHGLDGKHYGRISPCDKLVEYLVRAHVFHPGFMANVFELCALLSSDMMLSQCKATQIAT